MSWPGRCASGGLSLRPKLNGSWKETPDGICAISEPQGQDCFHHRGWSGIGARTVRAFADQGAKVGFVDKDEAASKAVLAELEGDHAFAACDLRDIDALRTAFDSLADQLGPAQVLVNNAARDDRHDWRDVTP